MRYDYIAGNAVPKYEPQPQRQYEEQKTTTVKRKKAQKSKGFYKVYVAALFAVIFTVVLRYTIINEMTTQIADMNRQLARVDKEVQQASVHLESLTELNTVQEIATTQLNMRTPQPHQIVSLDLNMGDKAVLLTDSNEGKGFFTRLLLKCLEYLS